MGGIGKITFIVPTYKRPQFLIRFVRYFNSVDTSADMQIIIADGGRDEDAAPFDRWLATQSLRLKLTVVRHPETTLMERLGLILGTIDTPYVVLCADDDLSFFDWIDEAVASLDANPDIGVIFGDYMLFRLDDFTPYGPDVRFEMSSYENPPLAWLEDDAATERLQELGSKNLGLATAGWYALQRTSLLAAIVAYGRRFDLMPLMFERFFVVAQAGSTKTRMLARLLGARQVEPAQYRAPFRYSENRRHIVALVECCTAYLTEQCGFGPEDARRATETVLRAEIEIMKAADRKRVVHTLARRIPFLRRVWYYFKPIPVQRVTRDSRLPPPRSVDRFKTQQDIVRRVVVPGI